MESKYILNLVIFLALVVVAFSVYYYWWLPKEEVKQSEPQLELEAVEEEAETGEVVESETQGLVVEVLQEGTGEEAKNGDKVSVHYTGTLEDGVKFDSSLDRGQPFTFTLGAGEVIKGWDLGVLGMKVGEKRKLTISSELGYGERGTPGGPIPPNATLIFEVELLGVNQ